MLDRLPTALKIPPDTDLVDIALTLKPDRDLRLQPQYPTQLHGWFLHQIRRIDPELSQQLHDGQTEKAFTISQLQGSIVTQGAEQLLSAQNTYQWQITALSRPLCDCLRQWLAPTSARIERLPSRLELSSGNYQILDARFCYPPTTYTEIWQRSAVVTTRLELTFTTATSFRKRGNHMPLPIPENLFHSYLRRWNYFASQQFAQEPFLEWVNEHIVILRHDIRSSKVRAGKSGSVTGFIGSLQLGFTTKAKQHPAYVQLARALITCAPYFNTGHKVTFGLGQTQLGWDVASVDSARRRIVAPPDRSISTVEASKTAIVTARAELIRARELELAPLFLSQKKRQGGDRAVKTANLWAQIIARKEMGDSLRSIAGDLKMPYDTVKKYAQIASKHSISTTSNPS